MPVGGGVIGWLGWRFQLCDIATDTMLLELTNAVSSATVSPRLNRPLSISLTLPADTPGLTTTAADGDQNLVVGTRCIKAKRNGILRANTIVWTIEYEGDENQVTIAINAFDPMIRLQTRTLFDAAGHIAGWTYPIPIAAGGPGITGDTMIRDALANSALYEDGWPVGPTAARFPLEWTSGFFSTTNDLSFVPIDLPMTIGSLVTLMTDTGGVDLVVLPRDSESFADPGVLGQLNAADQWGSDLSGTIHFDYATGDYNVKHIRRSFDMSILSNKLRFLLLPISPEFTTDGLQGDRWAGSIEATDAIFTALGLHAAEMASRVKYGTYAIYQQEDTGGMANSSRPMFQNLFATESLLRRKPRELLFITPVGGDVGGWEPFDDYNIGDIVAVNGTSLLGPAFAADQRLYGFDVTIDKDGTETVGEFITSADAE